MSDRDGWYRPVSNLTATLLLVAAVGAPVVALGLYYDVSFMTTDTAQYVSVARNLLNGDGMSTDLIYFDVHYRIGGIPVSQTVWPPGFPVLIAACAAIGVDAKVAPFLVSLLSLALLPFLLKRAADLMGFRPAVSALVAALWLLIGLNWALALGGTTELAFTFSTVAAFVFVGADSVVGQTRWRLILAGGAAAASVAIRYAGLFFVAGLVGYFLTRWLLLRTRRAFADLLAISVLPVLTVLAIFGRNLAISGHATGTTGFVSSETSIQETVRAFVEAAAKIFGFDEGPLTAALLFLLAAAAICAAFPLLPISRIRLRRLFDDPPALRLPGVAVCYLATAMGALSFLSLTAAPGYINERYLLPLAPFAILWLLHAGRCIGLRSGRVAWVNGVAIVAFAIVLAGQVAVLAREIRWYEDDDRYRTMSAALQARIGDSTAYDFLRSAAGRRAPLLAPNGQLLGAILERPVLGLPAPLYTENEWTTSSVRALVGAYGVSYVVYFPALFDPTSPWHRNRTFFAELERGAYPDWLVPFYNNGAIEILEVRLQ